MIIRKAKKEDLKDVSEIYQIGSSKQPYNKKRTPQKVLEIIKEDFKSNDIYVAVVDNQIAGFIMVKRDSGIKDQLWINEIWVSNNYQSHGVGTKLLHEIESIYKKKGIKIFELVAHTEKGGAFGFYKKLNYQIDKSMVYMKKRIK